MSTTNRLVSLDIFRGMTIAFMILVNTPGSWTYVYAPLRHAAWDGCTPTDLVFPFFLFIVGVSMYLAFSKFNHQLTPEAIRKIGKRTLIIFLIGLALNWFPFYNKSFEELRIMGVLQRIALAYGFGALICLSINRRNVLYVGGGMLLLYWALMWFLGGDPKLGLETNFQRQLDLLLLGENHLYKGYTNAAGEKVAFDPEGILSTLSSIVTVMFGYWVGSLIKTMKNRDLLIKNLLIFGVIGILMGWAWDKFFPINKPIWSSSYVLYTAGMATVGLALCIEFIDLRGKNLLNTPFLVFGMNSLFSYVLSGLFVKVSFLINIGDQNLYAWLYSSIFQPTLGDFNGSLIFAITYVGLIWLCSLVLYRRQIFIKI